MAFYTTSIVNGTFSTTNDTRTWVTTASGAGSVLAITEYYLGGEASATAVMRLALNRPSAVGVTGTGAQTPEKLAPSSPSASFSVFTGWSGSQPTLSTNNIHTPTFNAFGGVCLWGAPPGQEIVVGSQGAVANLSLRSLSGTTTCSGHFIIEER